MLQQFELSSASNVSCYNKAAPASSSSNIYLRTEKKERKNERMKERKNDATTS
jgi:hypothetical protein